MTAEKLKDPRVRAKQYARLTVPVANIASAAMFIQLAQAPTGMGIFVTRCTVINTAVTAALGGVGANDNLVVRSTNASGSIKATTIVGVGFLDNAAGTIAAQCMADGLTQPLTSGEVVGLAYAASADGVTVGSATGFLQVNLEYDLVSVTG
jgi:hypothetical protein